jgi:hypothetical protein
LPGAQSADHDRALYGYHSQKSGVPRFFPDGFAVSPRRVAAWSQGGGQIALIDIRLAKAAEKNGRPDRANE